MVRYSRIWNTQPYLLLCHVTQLTPSDLVLVRLDRDARFSLILTCTRLCRTGIEPIRSLAARFLLTVTGTSTSLHTMRCTRGACVLFLFPWPGLCYRAISVLFLTQSRTLLIFVGSSLLPCFSHIVASLSHTTGHGWEIMLKLHNHRESSSYCSLCFLRFPVTTGIPCQKCQLINVQCREEVS